MQQPGPSPASLDGAATRKQTHISSPVQTRIHNKDSRARGKIIEALMSSEHESLCRAGGKIRACCRTPLILVSETGDVRVALCKCKHRMCPTCSRARSREASESVRGRVKLMNSPRFMTLTLKATEAPLVDQVDQLLSCFRQLRRLKIWKDLVVGGIATIECTWNAKTERWHPHIHAIVDGRYFPQPQLKSAWLKVTGDSSIVDVRKVNDATQAARYVASYMCKHGAVATWPRACIQEFTEAMHGRRMLQTFGNQHGVEVDKAERDPMPEGLEPLATSKEIDDLADEGHADAQRARRWLHRCGGAWRLIWPGSQVDRLSPTPPTEDEILACLVEAAREVRRRSEVPGRDSPKPPISKVQTPMLINRRMNQ